MKKIKILIVVISVLAAGGAVVFSQKTDLLLTQEESDWLRMHPEIRITPDPSYPPIEIFKDGVYSGIAADYMDELERILNISFIEV